MKRTGFSRPTYAPPPAAPLRKSDRPGVYAYAGERATPIAKMDVCRSEAYRRLVAAMPCKRCGIVGYSQHAHGNQGKGMAMKTDDRNAFPLCADRPGVRGCHSTFDQGAAVTREARRLIEQAWASDTRRQIEAAGLWPANLPKWIEA